MSFDQIVNEAMDIKINRIPNRYFPMPMLATKTEGKVPLTIKLKRTNQKIAITKIANFPCYAKYSVRYGEETFRYFELFT
jgi:hypothetical protein